MSVDVAKRRILSKVPLQDLIGETVALQKRSGRNVGLCPFHEERTPSFYVFNDRYFCFGCKESGDAIDFVRKQKGLSFMETLRFLAQKYGVEAPELDERSSWDDHKKQEISNLFHIMTKAQEIFFENLYTPRGKSSFEYLLKRGFSTENIAHFGFGLTPEKPWDLSKAMQIKGFAFKDLEACSLGVTSQNDGKTYDFFRNRIMIPIRDPQGRIIAFGGRTTDNNPAKYLNSRETVLFDKSSTLFGYDKAREHIRKKGRALIVEGYMDTLQLWQQGFSETVACLGTALTVYHLKALKSCTEKVILLFDGDTAGEKASLSAITLALQVPEIHVMVALLPKGEDPDTFVIKNGPAALESILSSAQDLLDYTITSRLKDTHRLGVPDLIAKVFIPWFHQIPDPVQRSVLMARVSHFTGIPMTHIEHEYTQLSKQNKNDFEQSRMTVADQTQKKQTPFSLTFESWEFEFLAQIFYASPKEFDTLTVKNFLEKESRFGEAEQMLFMAFLKMLDQNIAPSPTSDQDLLLILKSFPEDILRPVLTKLRQFEAAFKTASRRQAIEKLIQSYRKKHLKETINSLKNQLAAFSKDSAFQENEYKQLMLMISQLNKELVAIESNPS